MTIGNRPLHQLPNQIQTILLFLTMAGLLGLLGYVLAGMAGAKAAMMLAALGVAFTPAVPPAFIMARMGARPMDPYSVPRLHAIAARLARTAGLEQIPVLYLLPSRQLNAFAMGSEQASAIGITHGLLSALTPREIAGILAHEITHIKNNDTQVMAMSAVFARLTSFLAFAGQIALIICLPLVLAGTMEVNLLLLAALASAPWISMFLIQALSRTREFEADLGSVILLNDPQALASALIKVDNWQRSTLRRFFPYVGRPDPMLMSHPPTEERVRRLMAHTAPLSGPGRHSSGIPAH